MIDYNFIKQLEGEELVGYVPDPDGSKSGITISTGVDLSQTDINSLSIEHELKAKLLPYRKFKGYEAIVHLVNHSLKLTPEESGELSKAVYQTHYARVKALWNKDASIPWTCVPDCFKTIMFSVIYQYGSPSRVPKFWKASTSLDWRGAVAELRDFGDRYPTRRNKEADYLEKCYER